MENYQFRDLLARAVSEPGTISAAYSAFHNYSIGNQLAALIQCKARNIPVGPISTLKDWNSKGRYVKRGEKALWLCMPITGKRTVKDDLSGEDRTEHYTYFVWKPRWFELAQTEGQEYKPAEVSNAWNRAKALEALEIEERPFELVNRTAPSRATTCGWTVRFKPQFGDQQIASIQLKENGSETLSDSPSYLGSDGRR